MKTKLLWGSIGLILGITATCVFQKIRQNLVRHNGGCVVFCQSGTDLSASWSKNHLDLSYFQENGNSGIVPAEVVFHDNSKMWYWIINNTFFMDFNRDGIADARVETAKRPKVCFIRQGDRWVECQDVFQNERSAIDRQGKTLVFRDSWQ